MDFVRLESGEVGIVSNCLYKKWPLGGYEVVKVAVRYTSTETARERTKWLNPNDVVYVSKEDYDAYIRSEKVQAAHKRARANSSHSKYAERDAHILELREQGRTYASIGAEYGLTSQRIHTICRNERRRRKFNAK